MGRALARCRSFTIATSWLTSQTLASEIASNTLELTRIIAACETEPLDASRAARRASLETHISELNTMKHDAVARERAFQAARAGDAAALEELRSAAVASAWVDSPVATAPSAEACASAPIGRVVALAAASASSSRVSRVSTSQYFGVRASRVSVDGTCRWSARTRGKEQRRVHLGTYRREIDAARAFDAYLRNHGLECAQRPCNFASGHIFARPMERRPLSAGAAQRARPTAHRRAPRTTRYTGVEWSTRAKQWIARIDVQGKTKWLGRFDTAADAAVAYDEYVAKHGLAVELNSSAAARARRAAAAGAERRARLPPPLAFSATATARPNGKLPFALAECTVGLGYYLDAPPPAEHAALVRIDATAPVAALCRGDVLAAIVGCSILASWSCGFWN